MSAAIQLDTKGMKCPLPVLRARKAMKPMAPGDILEIVATDPSSVQDFRSFCETTGDELLETTEADGIYSFRIRKAG
jgi:tRNA 2-thiouridine synthesizing protein A